MRRWRHNVVIHEERFALRPTRVRGTTPRFRLDMGAANPDPDGFADDVQGLLGEIETTGAGRAVFSLMDEAGHQVDIFPLQERGDPREVRAGAYEPRRGAAARAPLLSDQDRPIRHRGDDRTTPERERSGQAMTGLGGGSPVFVLFSSGRFTADGPHPTYGYLEPVVMLFHELVHAVFLVQGRQAQGSFTHRGASPAAAAYLREMWDNPREFYAVTVENILASELGIQGLRGAHSGFAGGTILQDTSHILLPEPVSVPGGARASRPERDRGPSLCTPGRRPDFLAATPSQMWAWSYEAELRDLSSAFPELWRRLSRVRAPFNPIRDTALGCVP